MELGLPLILVAGALFVVGLLMRRVRPDKRAIVSGDAQPKPPMFGRSYGRTQHEEPEAPPFAAPRPRLASFSVESGVASVTFAVPIPQDVDEILADVLVAEAIEVLRERRHTETLPAVAELAVYAGSPPRLIDRRPLPDGSLSAMSAGPSLLDLSAIAMDPLKVLVDEGPGSLDLPTRTSGDTVGPIGRDLRVPRAVDTGLRAQGIDPASMTAGQLVTGLLSLVGYRVTPGVADHTWFAQKGHERTFIREDPASPDGHPEVDDGAVQRFLFEFQSTGTDKGLFVSDKYAPFGVFDKEAREPRIRFLTRERLQKFVDGLALG